VRVLIDTHLLLWALVRPARLSKAARRMIDKSEIYVSAASIWEISIKTALGKLDADPSEVLAAVEPAGFAMLSISGEHAAAVARLGGHHKDPFDRLLIAQALVEPMHLLSNDELLGAYGAFVIIA
jgi:PIN domain nuclease of toxin-antitoxin system